MAPAAFTPVTGHAHWEVLLRARAIETQCYVRNPDSSPFMNFTYFLLQLVQRGNIIYIYIYIDYAIILDVIIDSQFWVQYNKLHFRSSLLLKLENIMISEKAMEML